MEQGNTVAIPQPVNEAPGLNAIWVFGENMQAALGLNHQIAVGNNQQICINPAGLAAGIGGPPTVSALLGGGLGGNMQLTLGTSVALTAGQAYEINLGPDKVDIHGSRATHLATFLLCGTLGLLAVAYAVGYGLLTSGLDYVACGTYTTCYQLAVDICLGVIMKIEMTIKAANDIAIEAHRTSFAAAYDPDPPSEPDDLSAGTLPELGLFVGVLGAIAATFAQDIDTSRTKKEDSDAHKSA